MSFEIRRVDYFYLTVTSQPGEGYDLLAALVDMNINLLAFTAIPIAPMHTHLTVFPEASARLKDEAPRAGLELDGPHPALLVTGRDEIGVMADIYHRLYDAGVNVYATTGVSAGDRRFGCVVYVRPEEYDRAVAALEV